MAYVSLYRKYRPQTFSDVVGQRHVITSLQNAIREDTLGHAYLFAGPRGTGKTTIARILAMAVNASEGPNPDPDPQDPSSVAIREGRSMDVIELDMASHGGVDDARELRDRAIFAPVELRKKVYILDEVHMASTAAFNALLKLIEEPPPHVLFAMATTDPQKVLPTILSRVQRLDLRRVGTSDLGEYLRLLGTREGFTIDDAALAQVLRAGEGSVRDTLSVLEQVIAFAGAGGAGQAAITEEHAAAVLGRTPVTRTLEVVDHLVNGDVAGTFTLVQALLDDGHDLRRFTLDLVQHLRDLLVVQAAPGRPDLIDASDQHRASLAEQAARLPRERLVFAVTVLGDILVEQRTGPPRLPLELALARLAVPEASGDMAALASRVAALESGAPRLAAMPAPAPRAAAAAPAEPTVPAPAPVVPEPTVPAPAPVAVPTPEPEPAAVADTEPEPAVPAAVADPEPEPAPAAPAPAAPAPAVPTGEVTIDTVVQRWDAILEAVLAASKKAYAMYMHGQPARLHNNVLTLTFSRDKSFHRENSMAGDLVPILRQAVQATCGIAVSFDAVEEGTVDRRPNPPSITPKDANVVVDPLAANEPAADAGPLGDTNPFDAAPDEGDPERAAPARHQRAEHDPFAAASADEAAAGSLAAPVREAQTEPVRAPAPRPEPEPVDEQALVREVESGAVSGPDLATAKAAILKVLDAVEVDESEVA